jgi:cytochrome oxidase assembly protein ShyY1
MADGVLATIAAYIPTMATFPSAGLTTIVDRGWIAEANQERPDRIRCV